MHVTAVIPNYNSADRVLTVLAALERQHISNPHRLDVVVVDDGSTDGAADTIARHHGHRVTLVRLPRNCGRSTARNAGVAAAHPATEALLFIDADCIPDGPDFVATHIAGMQTGAHVVFGDVTANGEGFWSRLQRRIRTERAQRHAAGDTWVFTTANVSIGRDIFLAVGGFDEAFNRYGFEDRDLFLRLTGAGARALHAPKAVVVHEDELTLRSLCAKQLEAGRHGASLFLKRHPRAYGRMAASRLDSRLHPRLRLVDAIAYPAVARVAALPDDWLDWGWLPFRLRAVLARSIYGLCYLHGTRLAGAAISGTISDDAPDEA